MPRILFILLLIFCTSACKSKKKVITKKSQSVKTEKVSKTDNSSSSIDYSTAAKNVVEHAKKFDGVRYKYGGTTKKGMDCSGLIFTSFNKENISLPRTTQDLAKTGEWIDLKEVQKGDLLFFATKKKSRKVNHVGIVTTSRVGNVEFIHASTSNGVMISNLAERYWYFAFVQARRVL
ncbi:MAG: C40 family peptidase [Flavobacteriaceae bacterium]|nr:C40 family peptidase [Flavobacteriaceae bacterium]